MRSPWATPAPDVSPDRGSRLLPGHRHGAGGRLGAPASESDMHFEVDVATNRPQKISGSRPTSSSTSIPQVTIINKDTGEEIDPGTMMPMIASDGPHYGNNISLKPAPKVTVESPPG